MSKIANKTPNAAKPWTESDRKLLMELWSKRLDCKRIGEIMGRKPNAIAVKAHRMSLTRRGLKRASQTLGKAKIRPCLVCQSDFFSEGPGNRICAQCKSTKEWRAESEYALGDL